MTVVTAKKRIDSGTEQTKLIENKIGHVSEFAESGSESRQVHPFAASVFESAGFFGGPANMLTQATVSVNTTYESQHWDQILDIGMQSSDAGTMSREFGETRGEATLFNIPTLKWPAKAHPILTDRVRELVQTLWAIVVSRSGQLGFPLRETVVSVFSDPVEEKSKAVLRLTCKANISQALAFWDSLEPDLQNWVGKLSEHDQSTFLTKVSMRVYWL